jgi:hypothetical protein
LDQLTGGFRKAIDSFNLAVTTIRNIQATLAFGALVIAAAITIFLKWRPASWVTAVLSALVGLGVGVIVGAALINRRARDSAAQTGFRVVEYRMDYALGKNPREHVCTRQFTLKATNEGASLFLFEYQWSGAGGAAGGITTEVPADAPYRKLDDSRGDNNLERRTIIGMNRPYARGEEVTVTVTQRLNDREGEFSHFLSKIVSDPLRKATLCIEFPAGMDEVPVPEASLRRLRKPDRWISARDLTTEVKREGSKYTLSVEHPPRGKKLYVRWRWIGAY